MADARTQEDVLSQIEYAFPIIKEEIQNNCSDEQFATIIEQIRLLKLTNFVKDIVIHHIEYYIRQKVAPAFWKKFVNTTNEAEGFELFKSAVDGLYVSLTEFLSLLKKLEYLEQEDSEKTIFQADNILARFKLIVRSTLLSQLPLDHEHIIEQFYRIAFNVFCYSDNNSLHGNNPKYY